jgi:hypothetical protein
MLNNSKKQRPMLPSLAKLSTLVLDPSGPPTGPPASSKRQRVVDDALARRPIEETLEMFGCVAVPLGNAGIDAQDFKDKVDAGTRAWFYARLDAALAPGAEVPAILKKGSPDEEKREAWRVGRDSWSGLRDETKTAFFVIFDLQLQGGRDALFVPATRNAKIKDFADHAFDVQDPARSEALAFYLSDRVTFVKQGDSRMGLSSMHKSWSQTGFGKWAHITPGVGLRAAMGLRAALGEAGIDTQLVGASHVIYKPPGGKELPAHTDGPRPATMITLLEAEFRKNGRFPTTTEWMQNHGVQSLVHFEGGDVDGYTYAIGPMTPKRLYLCLKAVRDGTIGATDVELFGNATADGNLGTARTRFLTEGTGPSFMRWKENFAKFNVVLAANGEPEPLREIPIRPSLGTSPEAFVALWPVGFPHGSAPNARRRITTTASLAVVAPGYKERDSRVVPRVRALATIASPTAELVDRARARALISSLTEPFYGGKTHLHPEHAGTWFDPTMLASGTGGWYRSIAPTPEEAEAFAAAWAEGDPRLAPTAEDWLRYEAARASAPPRAAAARPRFRDLDED